MSVTCSGERSDLNERAHPGAAVAVTVLGGLLVGAGETGWAIVLGRVHLPLEMAASVFLVAVGTGLLWFPWMAIPWLHQRRDWLAPSLASAGLITGSLFLHLHADSLTKSPWLSSAHGVALVKALLVGSVGGLVVAWLGRRITVRWVQTQGLPPRRPAEIVSWLVLVVSAATFLPALRDPWALPIPDDPGLASDLPVNTLLITVDTLRRDHLQQYGHERSIGACLEPYGFVAGDGFSAMANWTRPTTASILTGLHPLSHTTAALESRLPAAARTVTEIMADQGAVTGYFTANMNASGVFAMDQGAQVRLPDPRSPPHRLEGTGWGRGWQAHVRLNDAAQLNAYASGFLRKVVDRRFFLYVHFNDPHAPYRPPSPVMDRLNPEGYSGRVVDDPENNPKVSAEEKAYMELRYDGEIEHSLKAVAELLEILQDAGRLEQTLVLITADHGEEFLDHGQWTHGRTMFEEILSVPLLIRLPGALSRGPGTSDSFGDEGANRRVNVQGSQMDLLPTILDYSDVEIPSYLQGRSLRGVLEGSSTPTARPHLTDGNLGGGWSYQRGDYKLSRREVRGKTRTTLFHLGDDPGETVNLARESSLQSLIEEMSAEAEGYRERLRGVALQKNESPLSEDVEAELRAMGYVD